LRSQIPKVYRQKATFYTDQYVVYDGVIPKAQHKAVNKLARKTNHIERFGNTLQQRVSRLVCRALSFSKKLANHVGAIKLFICHYNRTSNSVAPALHGHHHPGGSVTNVKTIHDAPKRLSLEFF
jgi:hypothetical protein